MNPVIPSNTTVAVAAPAAPDFFAGALPVVNKRGTNCGQRLSFLSAYPAGDVKKALEAASGKKPSKAEVAKVMRGEASLAEAIAQATLTAACRRGFVPTVAKLNKRGDRLSIHAEYAKEEKPASELSVAELEAMLAAAKAKAN